jgi:hypothetical protein
VNLIPSTDLAAGPGLRQVAWEEVCSSWGWIAQLPCMHTGAVLLLHVFVPYVCVLVVALGGVM